jgi:hypothetical protein
MINENARSNRSIADAGNAFALTRQLSNGQEVQIFRIFSKVIRNLPASAILLALDAECKMLEEDVKHYRLNLTEDTLSIFYFRGFVQMVKAGNVMRYSLRMPPGHIEFYKKTILRLIQAGELRSSAVDQFDFTFNLKT